MALASATVNARGGNTIRFGVIGLTRSLCPAHRIPAEVVHSAVELPESVASPQVEAAESGNSIRRSGVALPR